MVSLGGPPSLMIYQILLRSDNIGFNLIFKIIMIEQKKKKDFN